MAIETVHATALGEHTSHATALLRLHDALENDVDLIQAALGAASYLRGEGQDADPIASGLTRLLSLICERLEERSAELGTIRRSTA
ncbi:MAG: hypothetical protein WAS21_17480 [Geminicoccaceae bacterium]